MKSKIAQREIPNLRRKLRVFFLKEKKKKTELAETAS